MDISIASLASNLLAPPILFFLLGLIAAFARSDLSIPAGAAKIMSIYLLLAIGFKGGAAVAKSGMASRFHSTSHWACHSTSCLRAGFD